MIEKSEREAVISWADQFTALKCCILIPTFNNAGTLGKVITDVSNYTHDILVVNDGSTDHTAAILNDFSFLKVQNQSPNQGKGVALRKGLKYAASLGFAYAITIDSDGQHFAEDIPWFLEKIKAEPGSLIIGARNMNQASVPGKSNLGNRISTFWFKFETGITLPDTQSGYRLYPLEPLQNMRFITNKYEFEIEVIVRAAWKGVPVTSVPVKVYYAPAETRISHFRPFRDFTRVGILNSVLVVIAVFYIKPRHFFRELAKKNIRHELHGAMFNKEESNIRKSLSVAFGIFMGIAPVWGYQMLIALSLSYLMKLNKVLVIVAANISIPPLIPVIIYICYHTGGWVLHQPSSDIMFSSALSLEWIKHNMYQYVVGSLVTGVLAGIGFGLITLLFLTVFRKQKIQ